MIEYHLVLFSFAFTLRKVPSILCIKLSTFLSPVKKIHNLRSAANSALYQPSAFGVRPLFTLSLSGFKMSGWSRPITAWPTLCTHSNRCKPRSVSCWCALLCWKCDRAFCAAFFIRLFAVKEMTRFV